MLHIDIIAVGRLRTGPLHELWIEYSRRLSGWCLTLHEIDDRKPAAVEPAILEKMKSCQYVFALDERGMALPSQKFAAQLQEHEANAIGRIGFVIGGADGLTDQIRYKANFLLSFGVQTWPHMLARVMLIEQIYRARQIVTGHPYHRA